MQLLNDVTVAQVALRAEVLAESITCEAVHQRFLDDDSVASVVVSRTGAPTPLLVNRRPFYEALTGRLGYGRTLHFSRRAVDVVTSDGVVLDGDEPLEAAAVRLLERGTTSAGDDVLVAFGDGWGVVPVSRLQAHLASRHAERAALLAASEARFRALVEHAVDVIVILDRENRVLYQSRPLHDDGHVAIGADGLAIIHPDDRADVDVALQRAARNPAAMLRGECRVITGDRPPRLFEYNARSFLDDPAVGGIVVNTRDITERRALEDQLHHQAFHDPLTRLANRELFFQRADYALQRLARSPGIVCALYIDLDGFKEVNDELGHAFGDEALVVIAERLRGGLRRGDTLARLGGDEFAVLTDGCPEHEVGDMGRRLLELITAPITVNGRVMRLSASAGLATTTAPMNVTPLLQRADSAMYAAKEAGKNRLERFDAQRHERRLRHRRLGVDLPLAIARGELAVAYQPIVDARTLGITGVEALVRWNHRELGSIPTPAFIDLAEQSGLIDRIGSWVLEQACRQASTWATSVPRPKYMSVNVSAVQLDDPSFAAAVSNVLRRVGLDPQRLQLEVTESGLATDRPERVDRLAELRELGVSVAIDDFGTGYSSLSYLSQLPFDVIKLDRSFVSDVERNPDAALLVGRVVELVHSLGRRVTAEGVETEEQHRVLRDVGCDDLQGFLFARPESADDVRARLRAALAPRHVVALESVADGSVDDDDVVSA